MRGVKCASLRLTILPEPTHTPSTDPLRRRVVGRLGVWHPPDRGVHRSHTRRNQLVKLAVDAHRVLVVSPPVLVERHVSDVVVCITS